jgi:hypothetical protein
LLCSIAQTTGAEDGKLALMANSGSSRARPPLQEEGTMLGPFLILSLILLVIGTVPTWPHSRNWGYYPTGGLGLMLVIAVTLLFMGWI